MRSLLRCTLALGAAALLAGCASRPQGSAEGQAVEPAPVPPRRSSLPDRDVITYDQIQSTLQTSAANNAYELIRMLRPRWLQKRGPISMVMDTDIIVYLNSTRMGGLETLRSLTANGLTQIRFLDAASATQRFGTDHPHGAIMLLTTPVRDGSG